MSQNLNLGALKSTKQSAILMQVIVPPRERQHQRQPTQWVSTTSDNEGILIRCLQWWDVIYVGQWTLQNFHLSVSMHSTHVLSHVYVKRSSYRPITAPMLKDTLSEKRNTEKVNKSVIWVGIVVIQQTNSWKSSIPSRMSIVASQQVPQTYLIPSTMSSHLVKWWNTLRKWPNITLETKYFYSDRCFENASYKTPRISVEMDISLHLLKSGRATVLEKTLNSSGFDSLVWNYRLATFWNTNIRGTVIHFPTFHHQMC